MLYELTSLLRAEGSQPFLLHTSALLLFAGFWEIQLGYSCFACGVAESRNPLQRS